MNWILIILPSLVLISFLFGKDMKSDYYVDEEGQVRRK